MSEKFDWAATNLLFDNHQAVAVYLNTKGDLVIRQQSDYLTEEDALIIIPKAYLGALVYEINECIKIAGEEG